MPDIKKGRVKPGLIRRGTAFVFLAILLLVGAFSLERLGYGITGGEFTKLSQWMIPQSQTFEGDHLAEATSADQLSVTTTGERQKDPVPLPALPDEFVTRTEGYMTLSYARGSEKKAEALFAQARESKVALEELFGRSVLKKVQVRLARSASEMFSLVPLTSRPPRYASGLAYSQRGLILLTESPRYPNVHYQLDEVFRHELAHIALHDAIGRAAVPRWFNEGIAVVSSGEAELSRVQSLFTASVSGNLFALRELTHNFPGNGTRASQAYAQSADFIRFLLQAGESHRFAALIKRLVNGQEFESALADAYASPLEVLEAEWHHQLEQRFSIWPVLLGGSLVWAFAIGLFFVAYFKRRRRTRLKLAQWAQQEAQDALELLVLKQKLAPSPPRESLETAEFTSVHGREPENVNPRALSENPKGETIPAVIGQAGPSIPESAPVMYVDTRGDHHTLH
jgi:hypothetical protein